ncbi:MAG: hypothetical protein ACQKBV_03810 [Puniceicoccales bacterium]
MNTGPSNAEVELDSSTHSAPETKRDIWPSLPVLLRWLGAITLISSALTFVLSDWMTTHQLLRYGQFLGFTMLLSACGWFCITRCRDDKGARTFFALTAALLPAHFAQLGGMFYANAQNRASNFTGMREAFRFETLPPGELWITLAIAVVVLLPLTYFGFAAMARKQARTLTIVYALANVALLLPIRSPNWIALIGFAMLGGLVWADHRYFATQSRMKTWDGIAMRTLLFAPYGLLIGRNLVLHNNLFGGESDLLISLMLATLGGAFYLLLPKLTQNVKSQETARVFAIFPTVAAWAFVANGAWLYGHPILDDNLVIPLVILPVFAIAAAMSWQLNQTARSIRNLAALGGMLAALAQLVIFGEATASLLAVLTGLVVTLSGYALRERTVFRIGLAGLGLGLLYHLRYAVELYHGPFLWISLGVTGVTVLLASSFLERYGRLSVNWAKTLHRKVSDW